MQRIRYAITDKINICLFSFIIMVNLFQFFWLPVYLLSQDTRWGLSILLLVPLNNTMWFLIHEAIHHNLNSNNKVNELMGRALSVMFGASFFVLSFGHIMHHGLNRKWESEFYKKDSGRFVKAKYYFKIFFGIYFTEVLGSLIMAFFKKDRVFRIAAVHDGYSEELQDKMENYFYKKDRIKKLEIDICLSVIFFISSLMMFGKFWPVFFAIIILRAVSISFMDNVFHYGTPADNSVPGKQVRAARLVSMMLLNGNYHGIHHSRPDIPWVFLPYETEHYGCRFNNETLARSMLMQLNGPNMV